MSTVVARGRYALAALAAMLACGAGAALAPSAVASSDSGSSLCQASGAPSSSHTIAVPGVAHVTVFTCGQANPPAFQQCTSRTVDVPNVVHLKVYLCMPPQATSTPTTPFVS
jgi:hypothetical protein